MPKAPSMWNPFSSALFWLVAPILGFAGWALTTLDWISALILGVVGGIGTSWAHASPPKPAYDSLTPNLDAGMEQMAAEAVQKGRQQLKELRKAAQGAPESIATQLLANADLAARTFDNIQKDPSDLPRAREFINYQMDALLKVAHQVQALLQAGDKAAVEQNQPKILDLLTKLNVSMQNSLRTVTANERMALETELSVMESMLGHSKPGENK